ncbi:threonine/serine dehydratase [Hyphomonas sp. FCG-A18]|uniref:threonine ammonia-lyase n=1 Tax=Hyphomonas sp. FCG-A18 TaxID=3080019 RepID=UPI002B301954|nr:threonine/serine dehydratase [Hyphomonas sp. FCG-A18]
MSDLPLPTHTDILAAYERIRGQVVETPILTNSVLNERAGADLFLKAECLQETGSFKLRGAMNRLLQIPEENRAAGVVAFSSGNHAQGIARAAKYLSMPALIVMPADAPQVKVDGVLADGAEIYSYDRNTEGREEIAATIAGERGAVLVPSFDDAMIIAGQGTSGVEFARQVDGLDHLMCCAGGGGLISGIALAFEGLSPETQIWTAEPEHHNDWARSLATGHIQRNAPGTHSICDAILTPQPGDLTWGVGQSRLSGGLAVSDDQIREAMRLAFRHLKLVVEPGGAAALAVALFALPEAMKGQRVGVVLTGGNVDADLFAQILKG